jgi:hypothetical protein
MSTKASITPTRKEVRTISDSNVTAFEAAMWATWCMDRIGNCSDIDPRETVEEWA